MWAAAPWLRLPEKAEGLPEKAKEQFASHLLVKQVWLSKPTSNAKDNMKFPSLFYQAGQAAAYLVRFEAIFST